ENIKRTKTTEEEKASSSVGRNPLINPQKIKTTERRRIPRGSQLAFERDNLPLRPDQIDMSS
ncbi:MAG TPA: hypothetical protein PK233_06505, partial [Candidatus Atribacteria bacterium]|nr:hypothetical protein [Candidatus Atribacteria bacterium]